MIIGVFLPIVSDAVIQPCFVKDLMVSYHDHVLIKI
jgi:hypothetical protein